MSLIRDRSFMASSLGHLGVDLVNGQRDVLLAALSAPLGLSNTLIGLVSAVYTLFGSLTQPLFGLLADRVGARWVAGLGILWMAGAFALAINLPGRTALVVLVLAALGSAAFHPAGTMESTRRARLHLTGQETLTASIFFLFGQGGLSLGPAIGGVILDRLGVAALALILLFVVPVAINAILRIPADVRLPQLAQSRVRPSPAGGSGWMAFLPFVAFVGLRSWSQMSMITFIPKYYRDLGLAAAAYGLFAALYMAGSAVGGVAGGWLGDRYPKRKVMIATLLPAAIPLLLMPALGTTAWAYLLVPLCGLLVGASHSIIVVLAQRMLPSNVGAASGLVLGFTFASGSLGTLVSGFLADLAGFGAVFVTSAATAMAAAGLAMAQGEKLTISAAEAPGD